MSKEESVKAAVAKAVETFGKIDIVVSNGKLNHRGTDFLSDTRVFAQLAEERRTAVSAHYGCIELSLITSTRAAISELSVDAWWESIDLNLKGTFTVATYVEMGSTPVRSR